MVLASDDREDDQNSREVVQPSSVGPWCPEVILISAMLQLNSGSELGPHGRSSQKEGAKDILPCCPIGLTQMMPREILNSPNLPITKFGLDANIFSWTSTVFRDGRQM